MDDNDSVNKIKKQVDISESEINNPFTKDVNNNIDKECFRQTKKQNTMKRKLKYFFHKFKFSLVKRKIDVAFKGIKKFIFSEHDSALKEVNIRQSKALYRINYQIKYYLTRLFLMLKALFKIVMPVLIPIAGMILVVVSIWAVNKYSVALQVVIDDTPIDAYVSDEDTFSLIKQNIASKIYSESNVYYIDSCSTSRLVLVEKNKVGCADDVFEKLYNTVSDEMERSYGVYVDGILIGCLRRESDVLELENYILRSYVNDTSSSNWSFINEFKYTKDKYDSKYLMTYANMLKLFTEPEISVKHTVSESETASSIALMYGITVPVLRLLNPGINIDALYPGVVIETGIPKYMLSVKVEDTIVYGEVIPYTTVTIPSEDLYEGASQVTREGANGLYNVTVKSVSINGIETSRDIESRQLVHNAVSKQIVVGIKTISPSGKFICPLYSYSYVSSLYGWRTLYGVNNFHRGIDIAAPAGTPIHAADGGVVCFAGWDTVGLGNCVKIDHGNGIISVYGHCSSIAEGIKTGVGVGQGQVIAYVGKTGSATGNHVHFALCYKSTGEYFNPYSYIVW